MKNVLVISNTTGSAGMNCLAAKFFLDHGKSIRDVILETRLERVRKLLRTTSEPISRIAKLSGFASACRLAHLFSRPRGLFDARLPPPRGFSIMAL